MRLDINALIKQYEDDPLGLLEVIGGFYEVKKGENGERLTPLVGYAGKYPAKYSMDIEDVIELQYVGEVYANFAKAEQYVAVMFHYGRKLWEKILSHFGEDFFQNNQVVMIGPQMGGVSIAQMVAYHGNNHGVRYACAEKMVTQVATEKLREQADIDFNRHDINEGDHLIIVEDVMNNFSTTDDIMELSHLLYAKTICVAGLLNRSMSIEDTYVGRRGANWKIPVIPLVRKPFDQYRQDDPYVAGDITSGNIVLKPKNDWEKLKQVQSAG